MGQVHRPQLLHPPRRITVPQPVADKAIPTQALADVESRAVDVDGQLPLGHGEVGNRDRRLAGVRGHRHLLLRMEAMRLEQP